MFGRKRGLLSGPKVYLPIEHADSFSRVVWACIVRNEKNGQDQLLFIQPHNSDRLIIPGVRKIEGVDNETGLARKIRLDLNVELDASTLKKYATIKAPAFGTKPEDEQMVENEVYFGRTVGGIAPMCTTNVYVLSYFNYQSEFVQRGNISAVDRAIVEKLHTDGFLP